LRYYELVVVLSPMLNQEQTGETWSKIKGFINTREGEITHEEIWGTRRLAYSIRKGPYHFQEGSYHLTRFGTESPFNIELETFLRLEDEVLRSMVVATDTPQPVVEARPRPVGVPAAQTEAAPTSDNVGQAVAEAGSSEGTVEAEEAADESEAPAAAIGTETPVAEADEPTATIDEVEAPALEEGLATAEVDEVVAQGETVEEEPATMPTETEEAPSADDDGTDSEEDEKPQG